MLLARELHPLPCSSWLRCSRRGAWSARQRHDRVSTWALATAVVALAIGLVTAGRGPVTVFGKVTPRTFRWLWPLGAFRLLRRRRAARTPAGEPRRQVVVLGGARGRVHPRHGGRRRAQPPVRRPGRGPNSFEYAIPAARPRQPHGIAGGSGPVAHRRPVPGPSADPYGGQRPPSSRSGDPVRDRGCGARAASRSGATTTAATRRRRCCSAPGTRRSRHPGQPRGRANGEPSAADQRELSAAQDPDRGVPGAGAAPPRPSRASGARARHCRALLRSRGREPTSARCSRHASWM